jgi:hypothetical protein
MEENRDAQQYFFTRECVSALSVLVEDKTVCLCVPTVAAKTGAVCLDVDTRFDKVIEYDLLRGLHSRHRVNTTTLRDLEYAFSRVLFDPPFSLVTPHDIAKNVDALLSWEDGVDAYVCYPSTAFPVLEQAFLEYGFLGEHSGLDLEYNAPPRNMGLGERREIRLYRFERVL